MAKKIIKKPAKKPAKKSVSRVDRRSPLRVGNAVFIRTVTGYYTGMVESVDSLEVLLSAAAWVADAGRWSDCLAKGTLREVEPYPDGIISVGRGAIVDVASWIHTLPRTVK